MINEFAAITARWIDRFHGHVFLVGSGADRARCDDVASLAARDNVHNLAGEGDLPVAAEIIRRAELFLGNDSGLAHLAAAVGTRPVVISGPGDPAEVAPYSSRA